MKKSIGPKTIVYPAPVFIVGTYDDEGRPNAMAASWGGICCSKPPCVAFSLREATYSYGNILSRRAFTISLPSEDQVKEADYFGLASGREVDKFSTSGLTAVKSDLVDAPFVGQFSFVIECRLMNDIVIGSHTQFIGEIIDVKVDEELLDDMGHVSIEKVRPIIFAPGDRLYYGIGNALGHAFSIGRDIMENEN